MHSISTVCLPITLIDSPGKSGASSICASLFPSRSAWQKSKTMSKSHFPSVLHRYILMQSAFTTRLLEHKKYLFLQGTTVLNGTIVKKQNHKHNTCYYNYYTGIHVSNISVMKHLCNK